MSARIDHLVVAAHTLDEGVRWCEAVLGVTPGPGGRHPLMGTHNRMLSLGGGAFARTYLEIIAIDPASRPTRAAPLHRWFDLDDALLHMALARDGPQLIHFVAAVSDASAAVRTLAKDPLHIDRGRVLEAARDTAAGRLEWQITVRDDGQRLFYGALPTLVQWGPVHPVDGMPASGVQLLSLEAVHPRAEALRLAWAAIGLAELPLRSGSPNLIATLQTPRGVVALASQGR
jgi:hypothetical protein